MLHPMSSAPQGLLDGLVDDAAMFPPGNAPLPQALSAHLRHRDASYAELVGPLLCSDRDLRELGETVIAPAHIGLVVSGGAGAVEPAVHHATRSEHVEVVAVEIALRDEDDLARNAERIIRTLDLALPQDAHAAVEVPRTYGREPGPSWFGALDEIAAAGHRLKLRTGGDHADAHPSAAELATFIDAALDRECPFKLTAGLHHAVRNTDPASGYQRHGFLNVLLATRTLFDGGAVRDAEADLEQRDAGQIASRLGEWEDATAASTRRWFASLGSCSIDEPVADLTALGLLR